ncbi:MAG: hypothetical protein GX221_08985 [Candidatus Riflebacteria bacterium]|nr:hypothetical protein [Candidatus Riflebacteria bacterium]
MLSSFCQCLGNSSSRLQTLEASRCLSNSGNNSNRVELKNLPLDTLSSNSDISSNNSNNSNNSDGRVNKRAATQA